MLTSLVLQLEAEGTAVLPASLGRAGQGLLLRLIGERDPALARALHDAQGLKPYTVSNLVLGKRAQGVLAVEAGQRGWLRLTGLNAEVSGHLAALAAKPPALVELDGQPFQVGRATVDPAEHPWAGQTSYQDLAAPFLLGGQERLGPAIRLEFASPTTFRSGGHFVPLPLPELVFGSLLDRWQSFAPIALHPETRRFAAEAVGVSRYALRTRGTPLVRRGGEEWESTGAGGQGGGGAAPAGSSVQAQRSGGVGGSGEIVNPPEARKAKSEIVNTLIGFTGRAVFTALNRDRYWLSVLHLLAAFAFYSGVGYQTGAGLGQARRF